MKTIDRTVLVVEVLVHTDQFEYKPVWTPWEIRHAHPIRNVLNQLSQGRLQEFEYRVRRVSAKQRDDISESIRTFWHGKALHKFAVRREQNA